MTTAQDKIRVGLRKLMEGLPMEAFAIVGDPNDLQTWKLPHHTGAIFRALAGRLDIESSVDWDRTSAAVAALSASGYRGRRVEATPAQILGAAHHLAAHYKKARKELPDTLAALIQQAW